MIEDINILATKKEFVIQKPVLLKGSSRTNFLYKIQKIDLEFVNEFNSLRNFTEKFSLIKKLNAKIRFIKVESELFKNNLILVESCLDLILANLVLKYYESGLEKISDLTELVIKDNPVNFADKYSQNYYEHKIKEFLVYSAFGLNSKDVWKGRFNAYVYVRKDRKGELIFYPLYEIKELEEYLFQNTILDVSNSVRNVGKIYEKNAEFFIKLNLQIRFC